MKLQINQIQANGKNLFQVIANGALLYRVDSSWVPMITDSTRKITMTDTNNQVVFQTLYDLGQNLSEELLPFKYLITGSQKFDQYGVIDGANRPIGAFYIEANGVWNRKIILQCGNRMITGYRLSIGTKEVVSFYENEHQIGQLTKSHQVAANLDEYFLHFVNGYENWLPIIAFFTVYYDFVFHNNSGQAMNGVTAASFHSISDNEDKYNKDFILNNFGQAEAAFIDALGGNTVLDAINSKPSVSPKTWMIICGVVCGIAALLSCVVFPILGKLM